MENDLARLRIEKDEEVWQFNGEGEKIHQGMNIVWLAAFLRQFYQKLDIDRVINGAPWTFNNHLLLFHQLGENENPLEFAEFLGKFMEYDTKQINGGFRTYMRIKVLIDVRMPLKQRNRIMGSFSKRGNELEMGCDLSLRANPRKATIVTSVWLREDDNEDFLGFWRYGQWFGKEGEEGRRVEFISSRDLIEHDAKDNLMQECEGKKRPRDGQHTLNEVDLAETIGSNQQQDSSNYHKISTAASGQTDRT
ncbi:hypothetical protein Goklo_028404 [Gossypium klotzschianum]|uniref:DUF4283 domain-containing protein n=1 Tax=Gossypium klotzschianum TaxID=34286 RepID=A0A7J8U1E4_9ROSI|nr:hypothetical protein [Gossypium klotzschianum]